MSLNVWASLPEHNTSTEHMLADRYMNIGLLGHIDCCSAVVTALEQQGQSNTGMFVMMSGRKKIHLQTQPRVDR